MPPTLNMHHVMSLEVQIGVPIVIGDIGSGVRRVLPITGGTASGPLVHGEVLPGGADWNLQRPDGDADIWAKYVLRTADGSCIVVTNAGTIPALTAEQPTGFTVPTFEVADAKYQFLMNHPFVGTIEGAPGAPVRLQF